MLNLRSLCILAILLLACNVPQHQFEEGGVVINEAGWHSYIAAPNNQHLLWDETAEGFGKSKWTQPYAG